MLGEKDRYESNTAGQANAPADQDQTGQTPQNDEAERLRREAEEARRREEELRELVKLTLQQQQQSYSSTAPRQAGYETQPQPQVDDIEIPEDLDFDNPKEVVNLVRKLAKKEAEKMAQSLLSSYTSDRQQQMAVIAATHWENFRQRMTASGRADLVAKVERYIRENSIQPDQLISPDAYDQIAAYLIGQEVYQQQIVAPRAPNLSANGRAPAPEAGPAIPDEVEHEFRRMARFGDDIDLDELARIAEKGEMTSEDYRRLVKEAK